MPYLINPGGRIVEVNTPQEFEKWKNTEGFTVPTKAVIDQWFSDRKKMIWEMQNVEAMKEMAKKGIYLATVSQGGKDGYGIASKMIMKELEKIDVPTKPHYMGQKIAILFHNPYSVLNLQPGYRIIYTMFESDKIPDDWISYLNAANMVLVPSKWCQKVFKNAGIDSTVVPLGYDHHSYQYIERKNKREQRKDFVFLHYNAFNARKGFLEVFKAFSKAFSPDEPVKMIMKTVVDRPYQRFPISEDKYPNIEVVEGKLSEFDMFKLMEKSDCFVFPSRGEGFGITPLEAMATGMPAIVPNAHGISEYFDSRYMYEVKVQSTCPALYSRYKGLDVGKMVVCDVDHLASQMRYIYEHQDEALEKGKLASEYVKQWTFENTAKQIKTIFNDIQSRPLPKSRILDALPLKVV